MKKMKNKLAALCAAAAMVLPCMGTAAPAKAAVSGVMRDVTTMQIVDDMGLGINLGNTFESAGDWIDQWGDGTPNAYETAWGSPTITQKMIQGYADEGFGVVRIPVAWSNMMSKDGSYTISPAYLARVREVVDWALEADLYVVLNLHWDGGWLEDLPTAHDECMRKYSVIWTQVADAFSSYGDKLIFESQNEELGWQSVWNQWGGTQEQKQRSYGYVNEVNQTFVDIVRASGGNNGARHLLISGYTTDVALTCDPLFVMPNDPAGRCAVSVHYYTPATFCILEKDADWGKAQRTWGTDAEVAELSQNMDKLKSTFVDKGIPVIIGEYGCPTNNKDAASVTKFLTSVAEQAVKRGGICPVLWDVTGLHYDRGTCRLKNDDVRKGFAAIRETYTDARKIGEVVDPIAAVPGDVDGDGKVDVLDLGRAKRGLVNGFTDAVAQKAADVDGDGSVTVTDIVALTKWLHGTSSSFSAN